MILCFYTHQVTTSTNSREEFKCTRVKDKDEEMTTGRLNESDLHLNISVSSPLNRATTTGKPTQAGTR